MFVVIVIKNSEVHYIEMFDYRVKAEIKAIQLSNEYYNQKGVRIFAPNAIKSVEQMQKYYQSQEYFNCSDDVHIVVENVDYKCSFS